MTTGPATTRSADAGVIMASTSPSRYVYRINPRLRWEEGQVNRGVIGTIIGVLVVIILVLVIMRLM